MKLQRCLIIFVLMVSAVFAVEYKDCGSKTGKVTSFVVNPCSSSPCQLKKGSNATVHLEFSSNVNSKSVSTYIYGIIAGAKVPFPGVSRDSCANNNIKCPISEGGNNVYDNFVFVDNSYPKVKVIVQLELKDDNNEDLACVVFPAEIVD